MILDGMSLSAFTTFHVALSLLGGCLWSTRPAGNALSLGSTPSPLSSRRHRKSSPPATGFLFPFKGVTPGIVIGILSIFLLVAAILARYSFHLAGHWRATYVAPVIALWFNVFGLHRPVV